MSEKSCIICKNYLNCRNKEKSISYVCQDFRKIKIDPDAPSYFGDALSSTKHPLFTSTNINNSEAVEILIADAKEGYKAFEAMDKIISENRMVTPDVRVPIADLRSAPNFYTWCVSEHFLHQAPFLAQAILGTLLFAEWCPHCSDKQWFLERHKVTDSLLKFESKVVLLEHGRCPHCKRGRNKLQKKYGLKLYRELAAACGQRSGKSAFFGMAASYLTHKQIMLDRPCEIYNVLQSEMLHGTFVALTFAQAKDTLWENFYGALCDSPWFSEYHEILNDQERYYGEGSMYKLKDTFVVYKYSRLYVYPAGPDRRTLRGRTRYLAGIDELGHFPNDIDALKNVKMNADGVYEALERSLLTVRSASRRLREEGHLDIPTGYFLNISSPTSQRDKIMTLVRQGQNSDDLLGIQKATWEMNPTITIADLKPEFDKSYDTAMCDYGAQPPLTHNAWQTNPDPVEDCLSDKKNGIVLEPKIIKSTKRDITETYAKVEKVSHNGRPTLMAIDAGISNNSFAFAVGYLRNDLPVICAVGEIMPKAGMKINFSLVYREVIAKVIENFNVKGLYADRFQSEKFLSDAAAEFEIVAELYSVKYKDMSMFKSYMEDGLLKFPKPTMPIDELIKFDLAQYPKCFDGRPQDHFIVQILTVQDSGRDVIKGDKLTDDILRASFLLVTKLLDQDCAELLAGPSKTSTVVDIRQMAVVKGYSSGSGSGSMGGGALTQNIGTLFRRG